ncbi:MAG: pgeF [Actinomycetia bacterium]|nr:pgeF [Actinomycetes bacterium]
MPTIRADIGAARVLCTDRARGVSVGPYASRNLGDHVGDDPAAVSANRTRLEDELPGEWVWLRQVHGTVVLTDPTQAAATAPADAAVTSIPGRVLAVVTADCAPIVLVADGAVGVVHAGWPGLEQGVIGSAVDALRTAARGDAPVRAFLGPCVHPARYEFGSDDLDRLATRFGPEVRSTTLDGTPAFDLPAGVRVALREAGVEALDDVDLCTAESPRFFSYRRDGVTGRQATAVVLT